MKGKTAPSKFHMKGKMALPGNPDERYNSAFWELT
jgi:hypothetical protein